MKGPHHAAQFARRFALPGRVELLLPVGCFSSVAEEVGGRQRSRPEAGHHHRLAAAAHHTGEGVCHARCSAGEVVW